MLRERSWLFGGFGDVVDGLGTLLPYRHVDLGFIDRQRSDLCDHGVLALVEILGERFPAVMLHRPHVPT